MQTTEWLTFARQNEGVGRQIFQFCEGFGVGIDSAGQIADVQAQAACGRDFFRRHVVTGVQEGAGGVVFDEHRVSEGVAWSPHGPHGAAGQREASAISQEHRAGGNTGYGDFEAGGGGFAVADVFERFEFVTVDAAPDVRLVERLQKARVAVVVVRDRRTVEVFGGEAGLLDARHESVEAFATPPPCVDEAEAGVFCQQIGLGVPAEGGGHRNRPRAFDDFSWLAHGFHCAKNEIGPVGQRTCGACSHRPESVDCAGFISSTG